MKTKMGYLEYEKTDKKDRIETLLSNDAKSPGRSNFLKSILFFALVHQSKSHVRGGNSCTK
jgi:hypothetical protein